MVVAVFGGSQTREGVPAYAQARELGTQLAQLGHVVITGGYMGTMEAVSRGASESGGHVVGVTCEEIEAWRNAKPNPWVKEQRRKKTLFERLHGLMHESDAAIALPGGPGTLAEISLMWNLMIIKSLPRKPLILVGDAWQATFDLVFREFHGYIPGEQRELLYFAENVNAAVELVKDSGDR